MKSGLTLSRGFRFALLAVILAWPIAATAADSKASHGKRRDEKRSSLDAWKAQHQATAGSRTPSAAAAAGTPIVGRASMVINGAGTVAYTQNFIGDTTSNCDADLRSSAQWVASTAHALHDHVVPVDSFSGNKFMAMNAGTTGAVQPVWPVFGGTVVDGTITWINVGEFWAGATTYPLGAVVEPTNPQVYRQGFVFQVVTAGTTGGSQPAWPVTAGATVADGSVTWKAIGFYPGSFTGCNAMQIVSRASGGTETVVAREGDAIGANGEQLMGWSEFIAMNASGKIAFRAESAGFLRNDDESSSGIFTAGPGAGSLAKVASNNTTIGGRRMCGFSSMVGMNDAGQLIFDGYAREHEEVWQPNHAFNGTVYPTVDNGLAFAGVGTSGATEPVWPTVPGQSVADGTITWTSSTEECDENDHSLIRFTSGPGNELLVGQGSSVGGSTVIGFGSDDNSQAIGFCGFPACEYENIEGFINASGHAAVVLNLADGSQGVFTFTGPGVSTQVARTGVAGVTAIGPRVSINNADQVVYRAMTGGVNRLFRFTPPATTVTIVSEGDVINGQPIVTLGAFTDINSSGNVVFQGKLPSVTESDAFFYWDGATTQVTTNTVDTLASEMITLNDSNLVAYVTGSTTTADETDGGAEDYENGGIFFWTKAGGSTKAIAVGDNVNGDVVTTIYAQHTSFTRRQLSSAGCIATAYHVLDDDPGFDCTEGGSTRTTQTCNPNFAKGGQLFISCGAVCPAITLAPPTLPGATQNTAYSQLITASGGAAPYTFTETGALPTGITLTAGGTLAGTPTVTGTFPITVTATDINACTGQQVYSLIVGGPTQVTVVLNPPSRTVVIGGSATLTVSINIAQATDTIVTLVSGNTGIVTVPATTTILAGQLTGSFLATAVSVGGPVTITATLPAGFGAPPATASITVLAAPTGVNIPTLNPWGFAILGLALAAAALLLMKK